MKARARASLVVAVVATAAVSTSIVVAKKAEAANACLPAMFTVAGSGQRDNPEKQEEARIVDVAGKAFVDFYKEYGAKAGVVPINYPAVGPSGYFGLNFDQLRELATPPPTLEKLLGLFSPRILLGGLESSENEGVKRLRQAILNRKAACPKRNNFTILGYSQGADVIARTVALPEIKAIGDNNFVTLIGDPSFIPNAQRPANACRNYTENGSFNPSQKGIRPVFNLPTYNACQRRSNGYPQWNSEQYCLKNDQICNYTRGTDLGPHLSYAAKGFAKEAGFQAAGKVFLFNGGVCNIDPSDCPD